MPPTPEAVPLDEILRSEVGSGLHGIAIEGTDDHDEMGIFVEPADAVIGIDGGIDHDVWRTQPEGARSGPGDTDLVRYSLRKYMRLAVKIGEVMAWSDQLDRLLDGRESSPLRADPDLPVINDYMRRTHLAAWRATGGQEPAAD